MSCLASLYYFIPWLLAWPREERNRHSLEDKRERERGETRMKNEREKERERKNKEKSALRWRVGWKEEASIMKVFS